jgi:hypothetical protein
MGELAPWGVVEIFMIAILSPRPAGLPGCVVRGGRENSLKKYTIFPALALFCLMATEMAAAATPGLPFSENFSTQDLMAPPSVTSSLRWWWVTPLPPGTTATWSTTENAVYLGSADPAKRAVDSSAGEFQEGTNVSGETDLSTAITFGDLDDDGDLDLVVGNYGVANLLYLNDGNGGFPVSGTAIDSDNDNTTSLVLGDVDGDGDLDLVVGNDGQNHLYINRLIEDGYFHFDSTAVDIGSSTATTTTIDIALGDVDGDGDLDLVECNDGQTNRLYLNDGSGGFSSIATAIGSESDATRAIILADVDGDGDLDVLAGNNGETNKLYFNNGQGGFGISGTDLGSETDDTVAIGVADVDNDGDQDLVVINDNQDNKLYLNQKEESGTNTFSFAAATSIGDPIAGATSIALGDTDNDGDVDLVVGVDGGINRLYLNDGSGVFSPAPGTGGIGTDADATAAVALGDVDGDGDLDVVAGNNGQFNKLYLNNSGVGFATDGTDVPDGNTYSTTDIALEDLDGDVDGNLDLVIINNNQASRSCLNDGGGTFSTCTQMGGGVQEPSHSVAVGDVDKAYGPDIVAGNYGAGNTLYLNDGSGTFAAVGAQIDGDADDTNSIALGDVDGDGNLDLVTGNNFQVNKVYLNIGAGGFPLLGTSIGTETDYTYSVKLVDVDINGTNDFLLVGNAGQANRLYLYDPTNSSGCNPGTSGYCPAVDVGTETDATEDMAVGDVDGDGDVDLVVGNYGEVNRLYLYDPADSSGCVPDPNTGYCPAVDIGCNSDKSVCETENTRRVMLVDLDNDTDLDLVAVNDGQPSRYYLNDGSGNFTSTGAPIGSGNGAGYAGAVGDVDSDGSQDLVVTNFNQTNKLYKGLLFSSGKGRVVSTQVNSDTKPLHKLKLTATTSAVPPNTGIDYYLSKDDGQKWYQVSSDRTFTFPLDSDTTDPVLRWKAEMHTLSPTRTPVLTGIAIEQINTPPTFTETPVISGTFAVGNILSVNQPGTVDLDDDIVSITYQWRSDNTNIPDETTRNYTITPDNAASSITVKVTADDGQGGTATVTATAVSAPADSGGDSGDTGGTTVVTGSHNGKGFGFFGGGVFDPLLLAFLLLLRLLHMRLPVPASRLGEPATSRLP